MAKKARSRLPSPKQAPYTPFHQFSLLPTELRLQIWSHVPITPRIIEMRCPVEGTLDDLVDGIVNNTTPIRFRPTTRPSPLLSSCYESRKVMLQNYDTLDLGGSKILVNFRDDVLLIKSTDPYTTLEHNDEGIYCGLETLLFSSFASKCRRLAIPTSTYSRFGTPHCFLDYLALFKGLEQVIFYDPCIVERQEAKSKYVKHLHFEEVQKDPVVPKGLSGAALSSYLYHSVVQGFDQREEDQKKLYLKKAEEVVGDVRHYELVCENLTVNPRRVVDWIAPKENYREKVENEMDVHFPALTSMVSRN